MNEYKSEYKKKDEFVKIYISNLGNNVSQRFVENEFMKYGQVIDSEIKLNKTFGYVILKSISEAEEAISNLHRKHGWKLNFNKNDDENRNLKENSESELRNEKENTRSRSVSREKNWSDNRETDKREVSVSNNDKKILETDIINETTNNSTSTSTSTSFDDPKYNVLASYLNQCLEIKNNIREIWIGNLPLRLSKQALYNNFFIYGEIFNIEYQPDKTFCFVKYYSKYSAQKAFENIKFANFYGNHLKVYYSDPTKRINIEGDEPNYVLNHKNCKIVRCSFVITKTNNLINNEQQIRSLLSKYGDISYILVRPSMNIVFANLNHQKAVRINIYIEYLTNDFAVKAITSKKMISKEFGDENLDIEFYYNFADYCSKFNRIQLVSNETNNIIKSNIIENVDTTNSSTNLDISNVNNENGSKTSDLKVNNMNMNMNNNVNNSFNMGTNIPKVNPMMNMNINPMNQMLLNSMNPQFKMLNPLNQLINPLQMRNNMIMMNNLNPLNQINPMMLNPNQILNNMATINNMNNNIGQINPLNPLNSLNSLNPLTQDPKTITINNFVNYTNNSNVTKGNNSMQEKFKDFLSQVKTKTLDGQEELTPKDSSLENTPKRSNFDTDYSLEEENLKSLWSGCITRMTKNKVLVDIHQIRNDCEEYLKVNNLNILHRISYEDIFRRPILGVVSISPSNETQIEAFDEYLQYFNDKQKAGVITLKNNVTMYVLPNNQYTRKVYINPKKFMIGIIQNSNSDMSDTQIILPPPLISTREKKNMKKNEKKDDDSKIKTPKLEVNFSDDIDLPDEVKKFVSKLKDKNLLNKLTNSNNDLNFNELYKDPELKVFLENEKIKKWIEQSTKS